MQFTQYELVEQRITHRLSNIAKCNSPFRIMLDGFGSHPSHTIFIQTQTTNQIAELSKALKETQAILKMDATHKPHFIAEANMVLANKLLPWQYEKGWLEYSNTPFNASFMVNELMLLKRAEGRKGYKMVANFPLLNQITKLVQASMF
ncbi:2'-5' RNA ligase family protein [Parasediminibacterium sp. JCM 36343]|uniref:2'-5' RNA ligase family protein n=1 Tax=Parasediminibacterium sp. JCM 36343 TaxID=3374279 RepID=UPI00397D00D9